MPRGITQCYLPPSSRDFPAFSPAKAGTRFSHPGERKAVLTWLVVISQDSLPAKDGHLSQKNNWAVSWLGLEATTL